jgi:hypothetical protein
VLDTYKLKCALVALVVVDQVQETKLLEQLAVIQLLARLY